MISGILYLLLLSFLWIAIGAAVTEAKKNQCSLYFFNLAGAAMTTLCLTVWLGVTGGFSAFRPGQTTALLSLLAGSMLNAYGNIRLMSNLHSGGRTVAYTIPLLGFLVPFVWTVVFGYAHAGWMAWLGLAVIVSAISLLGVSRGTAAECPQKENTRRICFAVFAMLLFGGSQIFTILPSLKIWDTPSPVISSFVFLAGETAFYAVFTIREIRRSTVDYAKCFRYALLWTVFTVPVYPVLFLTLACWRTLQRVEIVYPIACSLTIIGYSTFTTIRMDEKMSAGKVASLALMILGIFLVKLNL